MSSSAGAPAPGAMGAVAAAAPLHQNRAPIQRVGAGGAGNPGEIRTNAIASLSAYAAVRIKARVAAKSDRRTFRKKTGEGCFFNVDLCDADGGEIRGTFWGEECDKFFSVINEGAVYIIQNGDVKNANKKFNPNAEYRLFSLFFFLLDLGTTTSSSSSCFSWF